MYRPNRAGFALLRSSLVHSVSWNVSIHRLPYFQNSCNPFQETHHDKRMNDCLPPILFSAIFKLLKVLPDTELDAC